MWGTREGPRVNFSKKYEAHKVTFHILLFFFLSKWFTVNFFGQYILTGSWIVNSNYLYAKINNVKINSGSFHWQNLIQKVLPWIYFPWESVTVLEFCLNQYRKSKATKFFFPPKTDKKLISDVLTVLFEIFSQSRNTMRSDSDDVWKREGAFSGKGIGRMSMFYSL